MVQLAQWGQKQQWGKPVRLLLALLLLVGLAYLLAQTVWLLAYGPQDAIPADSSRPRLQGGDSGQSVMLSQAQVDGWQLFGAYQAEPVTSDKPTEAPDTRLQLELLGVFQTPDSKKASAIIAQKGKEGELYHIGDSIPGNASLEEIYPDRVILRRAGRLETLRWSDTSLGGVVQTPSTDNVSDNNAQADNDNAAGAGDSDLAKQRNQLVRQLGLEPVSQGSDQGYRLGSQAPKQLISQVGLKNDDVILSVNGYPLGAPDSDVQALRSYQETQQASIVVQRGDQQFTVNYPP
ncbi:hypothetical protein A11A3_08500 [Alcanivorax hongdengensis A-11-3]|uniref:Type II secretion system protein GspC N-terminal domain-containing protein n=1 Tax=Alcanivorax hongdengensis A-11-3 TaxID=1177179 RepID=L0WE78_9GAMM|nr:type II secretion system protein N [Alcanivorax hongdengensis]EKF74447.1 hypothetical protein A11A3_08500 [Alcanivorax hongdengensis A-11-3]